jgi:two-component system, NarL family, response regulator LiaR
MMCWGETHIKLVNMDSISTLIVDDHMLFAEALQLRLRKEPDLRPIHIATSAAEALAVVARQRPDVAILDYRLGRDNGADLATRLRAAAENCQVIMLSEAVSISDVVRAIRNGARAWLNKTTDVVDVVRAIRGVVRGDAYLSPALLGGVLSRLATDTTQPQINPLSSLTTREQEVLALLVDGLTRAEIAAKLFISANTARTHNQNLLAKLDAHSTLEAVSIALRHGFRTSNA